MFSSPIPRALRIALAAMALAGLWTTNGGTGMAAEPVPGVDPATKTITLGASSQYTGPVAFYANINNAAKAYFDMINARGGINGWKIKYIVLDDAYQPARAVANIKQLVEQDKVFALSVNEGSPTNAAAANYLKGTDVPNVAPPEGVPGLSKLPTFFVVMPNYAWEAGLAVQYAVQSLHAQKIAVMYEQDDVGIPALKGANAEAAALNMKIVADTTFEASTVDMTANVSKIAQSGADTVLYWGTTGAFAATLKAANAINFHPKWFTPFFLADPSVSKLVGTLNEGVYSTSWFDPATLNTPGVHEYVTAMDAAKIPIGGLSSNGWLSAGCFVEAFKRLTDQHMDVTRANLMKVLYQFRNVNFTIVNAITFTEQNHDSGITKEAFVQAHNGNFYRVTKLMPFPPAALAATRDDK